MGEMIEFQRRNGEMVPGYLARPQDGSARRHGAGVVLLQEWWGLSDQIKHTADRLAAEGYQVLLPDLYRGKVTKDPSEAAKLMGALDWAGALADIAGAGAYLKKDGKVAAMGFCMGGALAIFAGVKAKDVIDAVVCFYGVPSRDAADPAALEAPFLGHFATRDQWVSPAVQADLRARLEHGKVDHVMHVYEADHAFFNETRPEVHAPAHAQTAWQRTLDFLAARLA